MYIGIDCGTQGTKTIVYDHTHKKIVGEGYSSHKILAGENGRREQDPLWWIEALDSSMKEALASFGGDVKSIRGIGVSGQQHGLVILDTDKKVLRHAKLWNDTETAEENADFIKRCGGRNGIIEKLGTNIPVGYTASKLLWVKSHEPEIYKKIDVAINPKDYINYYLTGKILTDIGSASGTGYFDVNSLTWCEEVLAIMDDTGFLKTVLPEIAEDGKAIGCILPEIAQRYGLSGDVIVSPGSGDNMMAALGTGNVDDGCATMSLGTSGVLSIYSSHNKPFTFDPITQIQCAGNGGWLPTVASLNATSTSTAIQELFELSVKEFDRLLAESKPGADGIIMVPYFNGERMPNVPEGKGVIGGLTISNLQKKNMVRAASEAVIYGLRWGRDLLTKNTGPIKQIRINGGGSNSAPWRQITADIMNTEIVGVNSKESGAMGAALQAMWTDGLGSISDLCNEHIELDYGKHAVPNPEMVAIYDRVYGKYLAIREKNFGI
jgi:xylulokinase